MDNLYYPKFRITDKTAVHNMQAEINVSVLDAGYYVLKMTKGDGSTVARKITKM